MSRLPVQLITWKDCLRTDLLFAESRVRCKILLTYLVCDCQTLCRREKLRLMAFGEQKAKTEKKFRCQCRKKKKSSQTDEDGESQC